MLKAVADSHGLAERVKWVSLKAPIGLPDDTVVDGEVVTLYVEGHPGDSQGAAPGRASMMKECRWLKLVLVAQVEFVEWRLRTACGTLYS